MLNSKHLIPQSVQRHLNVCLCTLLLLFTVTACRHNDRYPVSFHRFERLLFTTDAANLRPTLAAHLTEYNSPLLNVAPDDERFMTMLGEFVADPVMRDIYRITDSLYPDLGWLEEELGTALARANKICPAIAPQHFYTLVTGDLDDYGNRVFCNETDLAISLDHYAVGAMERYQYFGLPAYIVAMSKKEYIVVDCMAELIRGQVQLADGDPTLLDYMIAEGKTLYLLGECLPQTPDSLLLRYTQQQMRWIQDNESQVWAWLIQNKMLYSTDLKQFHNLIDEAPKTNAFGNDSAPRSTSYLGWQIVKQYMKKSGSSVIDLLAETDSRKILTQSAWRP